LALLAGDTGRPSEAAALLNESMAIARELDHWRGQAQLLLELSKLRSDQGQLEEAEALLATATDLWPPQVQGPGFRAMALDELGRLRTRQGRHDQAISHLTEAASLWQQLGATAAQARTLTLLGDALAAADTPTRHTPPDNRPAPSNPTTLAPGASGDEVGRPGWFSAVKVA
jgi:tetratricopeptide (TPR) repeat protein